MKRNLKPIWFDIGYIDHLGQKTSSFVRYCKNPRLTREHRHLMARLDRREVQGVFYRPFDPELQGLDAYEIQLTEFNY